MVVFIRTCPPNLDVGQTDHSCEVCFSFDIRRGRVQAQAFACPDTQRESFRPLNLHCEQHAQVPKPILPQPDEEDGAVLLPWMPPVSQLMVGDADDENVIVGAPGYSELWRWRAVTDTTGGHECEVTLCDAGLLKIGQMRDGGGGFNKDADVPLSHTVDVRSCILVRKGMVMLGTAGGVLCWSLAEQHPGENSVFVPTTTNPACARGAVVTHLRALLRNDKLHVVCLDAGGIAHSFSLPALASIPHEAVSPMAVTPMQLLRAPLAVSHVAFLQLSIGDGTERPWYIFADESCTLHLFDVCDDDQSTADGTVALVPVLLVMDATPVRDVHVIRGNCILTVSEVCLNVRVLS